MIKHFSFEHEYIRKYIIKRRMKKDHKEENEKRPVDHLRALEV